MNMKPPKIDKRKHSDLVRELQDLVPHYTPEWAVSNGNDAGAALLKIFGHIAENVITRLNRVPHKNFVAFLDMLGIKLLPAQPARVPITFKLAKGTDKEILIPARTEAAADKTEEHEELSFETEKNLLAIPSQLKKVISVDPENDAIYLAPPGFLEEKSAKQTARTYTIVSSPATGSNNVQLDHVTDLGKDDFLKIVNGDKTEYTIISDITGTIVSFTEKLRHTHPSNTTVEKLLKFNLFEAKNMQEHSLYVGHNDLFNVKSTARFNLFITHFAEAEAVVTPLKVTWEYWGEIKGEEGERWHKFHTIDKTSGLTKEGQIDLTKMAEGEIKEKKNNGIKSRWIRCLIEERLSGNVSRRLPVLDNITFVIKSSGEKLLPDQAFNNDISLDVVKAFTPFGKEPRMFDNFSVASKEIFSKKGAKVTLDVDVEPRGILGSPTAIQYDGKIKVFAKGTYGRLVEIEIDQAANDVEPVWSDHGFPPETTIASGAMPNALSKQAYLRQPSFISVFAQAENGHLVERFYNGNQWQWIDHGTPKEGVTVSSDPSVIYGDNTVGYKIISVFIKGTDGNLHEFCRSPDNSTGTWLDRKKPSGTPIAAPPFGNFVEITSNYKVRIKIFSRGLDGRLYELDCSAGDNAASTWTDHGFPEIGVMVDSRPFAWVSANGSHVRIYVKGDDKNLWQFDNTLSPKWSKKTPPQVDSNAVLVDSDPHGYISISEFNGSETTHIFVTGSDENLWEWDNDEEWVPHQAPTNSKLFFSPFVLPTNENTVFHTFSASSQNSIIERENNITKIWNEYKDPNETSLSPILSWEYWNMKGWVVLKGLKDETLNLLKDGKITFDLPKDIEETEVVGQKSYWIRARIIGGDYGKETFTLSQEIDEKTKRQQLISTKNSIRPPIINSMTISYEFTTKQFPQHCLTYNNLEYLDQTEASRAQDKHFSPFVPLDDNKKSLYLGFDTSFSGGPVKIFFAAKELPFTEEKKPKLAWSYSAKQSWNELSCLDSTEGLIKQEILELLGPSDLAARAKFSNYLYWLKASHIEGEYEESPLLDGIFPNTTWAFQAKTIRDEILGSSDGAPDQIFPFFKFPVLEGQQVGVREILSAEEKQILKSSLGDDAIVERINESGDHTETWVLWTEVGDFFDSTEKDRHYILDRAIGEIQFGDGIHGMLPPAGDDNIKAFSYQAGGGSQGNIKAGQIKTLKSAVSGVKKAGNPVDAGGGADTATLEQMLEIGPAMISHRDRAVTMEDFEWLARQASRKIAKVRCLPNTNNRKESETGWVTVIIVPDSLETKPSPTLELRRKVQRYLEARSANTLSSVKHIHIAGPTYVEVAVSVDIFITFIDVAAQVEREAKTKLQDFFHPLTGGPEGNGWDFGRDVAISDIYGLLEDIKDVDHVENLRFTADGVLLKDRVEVKRDHLVASGTHIVNLQLLSVSN